MKSHPNTVDRKRLVRALQSFFERAVAEEHWS
jgi:hypothetical protein